MTKEKFVPAKRPLTVIRKALEYKYFPLAIALIAFLVSLPTIKTGLMLDDLIHRSMLVGPDRLPREIYRTGLTPGKPGKLSTAIFDLFVFCGDQQQTDRGREYGTLPWRTPKKFKASLWRPLTGFSHWLDYRLFPDSPPLMHVHSLLWFSAVIFLIAVFYRRLLGPTWVAALAVILYLIDENNTFPVMFNAHRNSLIALVFGLLCALAHHNWRKNSSLIAAVAAPVFLLLSLLSAEAGIATFAFILAYAIALEEGPIAKRAATIIPAVCTIILWRLVYNALGYGVDNIGIYVDPLNEPACYTLALLERLPIMLLGIFSAIPADYVSSLSPPAKIWFMIIVFILLLFLLLAMLPLLRKNKLALYFCLATIFAVIPFCACFPSSRNLLFASIPGFALIAVFITDVFKKASYLPKSLLYRIAIWLICISLFLTHLPGALLGKTIGSKVMISMLPGLGAPKNVAETVSKDQTLVFVNSPCVLSMAFLPFEQAYRGRDIPQSIKVLAPAFRTLEVQRPDEKTLIIKAKEGNLFSCGDIGPMHIAYMFKLFNDLFQDEKSVFRNGDKFILPQLTVTVARVDKNAMPTELSFVFSVPLEDNSLSFYQYDWHSLSYKPFEAPAVGQAVELPGPRYTPLSGAIKFVKRQITKSLSE